MGLLINHVFIVFLCQKEVEAKRENAGIYPVNYQVIYPVGDKFHHPTPLVNYDTVN